MPRFHCPTPLLTGEVVALPAGAARHVQVLRMQPGGSIILFNGADLGGEFEATIEHMGRSEVRVLVGAHSAVEREAARQVHLIVQQTQGQVLPFAYLQTNCSINTAKYNI
jgi:16S rRNA (uracil1498-N3)-methyltransferase